MGLFRSDDLLGIAGETLSFVLNAAAETHPNEYMGYLRAERASTLGLDREGRVITDVIVIPGTVSNPKSARVQSIMKPNASRSVGSVHSHPSGVLRPSQTDLGTFQNGDVHIIVGAPYEWTDWKAFDSDGNETKLDVLDVDVPDAEDFFDFTQEDIDRELASETRSKRDRTHENGESDDSSGILSWLRSRYP